MVRVGYWHFAFLGQESQWAAEACECAADQDAFWEYHDYLFDNHGGENQGAFSKENLKRLADELGLNTATSTNVSMLVNMPKLYSEKLLMGSKLVSAAPPHSW